MLLLDKITDGLKKKFLHKQLTDTTILEMQCFVNNCLYGLLRNNQLGKLIETEQHLLKVDIFFSDSGEKINIIPSNLFTACLLFDKYIPSIFIPKNATEIAHKDGSVIKYIENKDDKRKDVYELLEVDLTKLIF